MTQCFQQLNGGRGRNRNYTHPYHGSHSFSLNPRQSSLHKLAPNLVASKWPALLAVCHG